VTLLRWEGTALQPAEEPGTNPDVVDSWLEHDGYVGSWYLHRQRFAGHLPGVDVGDFLAAARQAVPHEGNWFPRVEAHGDALYLRVRPAPPLRAQTALWIPPTPDPRVTPRVKGPDLPLLAGLRAQAQEHGADDALLWSADGLVVEGANCALAWWEGDRLMVPQHPGQLASVTVSATRELLSGVGQRPVTLAELRRHPVWAGSALHGWTEVIAWVDAEGIRMPAVVAQTPMSAAEVTMLLRWN
jgi:branched-subunit amino acid aminotransferase/4-amino-4-deoxychorismate lyase